MFFHPGGGMATSTYLSAPPPEQYERALQGHRTRRTLCDVPVSVPNIDDLYCSIPIVKSQTWNKKSEKYDFTLF